MKILALDHFRFLIWPYPSSSHGVHFGSFGSFSVLLDLLFTGKDLPKDSISSPAFLFSILDIIECRTFGFSGIPFKLFPISGAFFDGPGQSDACKQQEGEAQSHFDRKSNF